MLTPVSAALTPVSMEEDVLMLRDHLSVAVLQDSQAESVRLTQMTA